MSKSDIIASLALVVAFFAFVVSILSYVISKRALAIDEQQNNDRNLAVTLYYIDAYKWRLEDQVYISFALRFTNQSTLNNSIAKIELHIEYHDESDFVRKVKVLPDTSVRPVNLKKYSEIIRQPLNLPEKSAVSGWVTFKLPSFLQEQIAIDMYEVNAETIDKKIISIDTHIVNEV